MNDAFNYIIAGITFAFAAAVQPGPLQAYIISQTLNRGFRKTLPAAFAPVISDGPIILLVLFILSKMPGWLINVMQAAGGIFLLYLAHGAYKSWKNYNPSISNEESGNQTLFKAVTVNLLNPNPYLGWSLVMGPLLIKGWQENPLNGILLLVSFYSTIIIGLVITIFLTSAARKLGSNTNRILVGISAIALAAFGFFSLFAALRPII